MNVSRPCKRRRYLAPKLGQGAAEIAMMLRRIAMMLRRLAPLALRHDFGNLSQQLMNRPTLFTGAENDLAALTGSVGTG